MFKTKLQNVALAAAGAVLVCAVGGCGTDWTLRNLVDFLPDSSAAGEAAQADEGDGNVQPETAAAEAGQLLQELETVLAGQNVGTTDNGLNAFLAALAEVASSSLNAATSQPAMPAHPFRQLRAEIHTLRHSLTREQVAQVLLDALAASSTTNGSAITGTGTGGFDLLAQVQNLLATLQAMNAQPATTP
jgi:hypothetical protein